MNGRAIKRLHDTFEAGNELHRIVAAYTREEFLDAHILKLAVWKLVEILGEALRQAERLEPNLEHAISHLRRIVNTRNRITHGYD